MTGYAVENKGISNTKAVAGKAFPKCPSIMWKQQLYDLRKDVDISCAHSAFGILAALIF